ncbi:unnamed protein product [Fraxinus pennsylvanica]|uniref:Uncharacterized protein n=1 Tax=Fraxinus pennsylvanica TaxID=56036 RepID=A0AAD2DZG8_9LAMI|nr:unnamed protein product [Fraxinus pennsylvanica]
MPIFRWALAVGVSVDKGVVGGGNHGDEERTLMATSGGRSESDERRSRETVMIIEKNLKSVMLSLKLCRVGELGKRKKRKSTNGYYPLHLLGEVAAGIIPFNIYSIQQILSSAATSEGRSTPCTFWFDFVVFLGLKFVYEC